jgi:Zn-finger nucleic acid-binding protein
LTYLKCTSCKARLYSVAMSDRVSGELCPACGAVLEPVGELAEVVGYRSIETHGDPAAAGPPHGAVIYSFDELLAGRRARAAQDDLDAERWLEYGDYAVAEAAALLDDGPAPPVHLLPRRG